MSPYRNQFFSRFPTVSFGAALLAAIWATWPVQVQASNPGAPASELGTPPNIKASENSTKAAASAAAGRQKLVEKMKAADNLKVPNEANPPSPTAAPSPTPITSPVEADTAVLRETRVVREAVPCARAADIGLWLNVASNRLVVSDVAAEGPISEIGLVEGDTIVSVNDQPVIAESEFMRMLFCGNRAQDVAMLVGVVRDGRRYNASLTPAAFTEQLTFMRNDPFLNFGLIMDDRVPQGTRIWRVQPRSPAYYAGLRAGDTLSSFNGNTITNLSDLTTLLQNTPAGNISLEINRNAQTRQLQAAMPAFQAQIPLSSLGQFPGFVNIQIQNTSPANGQTAAGQTTTTEGQATTTTGTTTGSNSTTTQPGTNPNTATPGAIPPGTNSNTAKPGAMPPGTNSNTAKPGSLAPGTNPNTAKSGAIPPGTNPNTAQPGPTIPPGTNPNNGTVPKPAVPTLPRSTGTAPAPAGK